MQPVRYLPPPGAPAGFAGPRPPVVLEGRAGEPFRAGQPDTQRVGREPESGRTGSVEERTARRPRLPAPLLVVSPDADYFGQDSGFLAQRLAQERRGQGLHIDRSAEGARAYDARAGYPAAFAATGGQVNIAV